MWCLCRPRWEACWLSGGFLKEMQEPMGPTLSYARTCRRILWHSWQVQSCCWLLPLLVGLHLAMRISIFSWVTQCFMSLGKYLEETNASHLPIPTFQEPSQYPEISCQDRVPILPLSWQNFKIIQISTNVFLGPRKCVITSRR
jgi:hypothetical protein